MTHYDDMNGNESPDDNHEEDLQMLPNLLADDELSATRIVKAINGLGDEVQLIRLQVQKIGTRIEGMCQLLDRVLQRKP